MVAKEKDQEFVEYVVKALVDKPEKVVVKRTIDERGVLIELDVDQEDMGKVIGKNGQTAKSIRTLLRVIGAKHNARVNLKITEPEGPRFEEKSTKTSEKTSKEAKEAVGEDIEL
jgi:predicted RNA-binding protein YlqC (UPF0109 family)